MTSWAAQSKSERRAAGSRAAQKRVVLTVKKCEWSQSEQTDNQPNVQYFLAKSHMNRVFYS